MSENPSNFAMGSPQTEWDEIEYRILHGEHPHRGQIARVLRRNECVPLRVREYIADILEARSSARAGIIMAVNIAHDIR
jgi:hypothetical protein